MRVIFPCKDCKNRSYKCHATCLEYKEAAEKNETIKRKAAEQREQNRIECNFARRAYFGYKPLPYNKRKGDIGA